MTEGVYNRRRGRNATIFSIVSAHSIVVKATLPPEKVSATLHATALINSSVVQILVALMASYAAIINAILMLSTQNQLATFQLLKHTVSQPPQLMSTRDRCHLRRRLRLLCRIRRLIQRQIRQHIRRLIQVQLVILRSRLQLLLFKSIRVVKMFRQL